MCTGFEYWHVPKKSNFTVVAIKWLAKGGMPDPLLAGFPDGTGEAEESDTIVGGEGGAELKVIKGGYSQYFNLGTVDS